MQLCFLSVINLNVSNFCSFLFAINIFSFFLLIYRSVYHYQLLMQPSPSPSQDLPSFSSPTTSMFSSFSLSSSIILILPLSNRLMEETLGTVAASQIPSLISLSRISQLIMHKNTIQQRFNQNQLTIVVDRS